MASLLLLIVFFNLILSVFSVPLTVLYPLVVTSGELTTPSEGGALDRFSSRSLVARNAEDDANTMPIPPPKLPPPSTSIFLGDDGINEHTKTKRNEDVVSYSHEFDVNPSDLIHSAGSVLASGGDLLAGQSGSRDSQVSSGGIIPNVSSTNDGRPSPNQSIAGNGGPSSNNSNAGNGASLPNNSEFKAGNGGVARGFKADNPIPLMA